MEYGGQHIDPHIPTCQYLQFDRRDKHPKNRKHHTSNRPDWRNNQFILRQRLACSALSLASLRLKTGPFRNYFHERFFI